MLSALKALKSEVLQAVSDVVESDTEKDNEKTSENGQAEKSEFATFLKGMLAPDAENKISEEALFAALAGERVQALKGDEIGQKFKDLYEANKTSMAGAGGYVPCEDAAKAALKQLRTDGAITDEEANKIYSEAFSAAQLDGNTQALYDGLGGAGDATVAVQTMEAALVAAQLKIDKFENGEETAAERSLDEASNGKTAQAASAIADVGGFSATDVDTEASSDGLFDTALATLPTGNVFDGANGFLFKPISDNDGNLAVLLPEVMAHKVESVVIKDAMGNVIEEGRSTGYGDLGTREKFSFSKPGGSYSDNLKVEVRFAAGGTKQYEIPDPAQRYD